MYKIPKRVEIFFNTEVKIAVLYTYLLQKYEAIVSMYSEFKAKQTRFFYDEAHIEILGHIDICPITPGFTVA